MTAPGADPRSNVLSIDSRPNGTRAETLISIDGVDLLELQRPTHRPDGSLYPSGPFVYLPPDPMDLLPPDSANLLPTTEPHRAMVGICSCGHAGCGSLWLQVRRDHDQVIWEPSREPPGGSRSTIDTSYSFELLAYLDAIDAGQRSVATWEERPRLLARELRRRRDGLDGLSVGSSIAGTSGKVVSVGASPAWTTYWFRSIRVLSARNCGYPSRAIGRTTRSSPTCSGWAPMASSAGKADGAAVFQEGWPTGDRARSEPRGVSVSTSLWTLARRRALVARVR